MQPPITPDPAPLRLAEAEKVDQEIADITASKVFAKFRHVAACVDTISPLILAAIEKAKAPVLAALAEAKRGHGICCDRATTEIERLTRGWSAAAERIASLKTELTSALAACKEKEEALTLAQRLVSDLCYGSLELHESATIARRIDLKISTALALQPDSSALEAYEGHLRESVEITVFRAGKILAVNSRRFGGFCGIGGKVEAGESFEQAARRELMEEAGCEALSIKFIAGNTLDPIKGDDSAVRWYCAGFIVDIGEQEPRANEEGTTPFWTTKEEMIANSIFPEWYKWWFGLLERLSVALEAVVKPALDALREIIEHREQVRCCTEPAKIASAALAHYQKSSDGKEP